MEGSNCQSCGNLHFPSRLVCPDCGCEEVQARQPEGVSNLVTRLIGDVNQNNGDRKR